MKHLLKKAGVILASVTLLMSAAVLPASAASLSENFESYGSTDDMSMNWFTDGSFITDLTLSKKGGADGSKGLKADLTINKDLPNHWALIRALYPEMLSETATGFRLWAKCDQKNVEMKVMMRYNNQSWKCGTTITLTTEGRYYDIPFSDMELMQGASAYPGREKDPTLIDEWQFEIVNDWSYEGMTVYIDGLQYIEPGQEKPTDTAPSNGTTVANGTTTTQDSSITTDPSASTSSDTTTVSNGDTTATSGAASSTTANTSANATTADKNVDKNGEGGLSTGAIVGIVIAAVVVLAGAGVAVYFLVLRKKKA